MVTKLQQGADAAAEEVGWRAADPSRYPQHVCRGLARLLSHGKVTSEGARWLAKQIGGRLPPRWGAVWMERGCSKLEGTLAEQLRLPTSNGDPACAVQSATGWNMPTVSPRVVHTKSTTKRGMSRVQCSNNIHDQSRSRRREVLCTEVEGKGDERR